MRRTFRHAGATSECSRAWTPSSLRLHPGWRSHLEEEDLLDAPATSGQLSGHGRSGGRAKVLGGTQFVMHDTPVVDTPDEIHTGFQRFYPMSSMATAACQRREAFAKCSIEPLDKRGVEHVSAVGYPQEFLRPFQGSLRHAPGDLHHTPRVGVFDHV